ncbi:unnamed protein product [Lasius platythorax]|uniref:Uncharacterized protein n=1 Tax=Lasius platythorax TaxID=488582 RepID=A0AAV2P9X2_9HYME
MTSGWTRVTASLVRQAANLFARRTRALMTSMRLPLAVMTDRRNFAGFVTRRRPDSLSGTAWHRYFTAAASTLHDVHSCAWIARTAVAGCGTLVLSTIKRIFARFLTEIRCILRYAIATFFITQVFAAQAHLSAFLVAVKFFYASNLFGVTAASAGFCYHFQALTTTIGMASHVAEV